MNCQSCNEQHGRETSFFNNSSVTGSIRFRAAVNRFLAPESVAFMRGEVEGEENPAEL